MELTTKQLEGLKRVVEKYRNGEKYAVVSGYAGTGKSTLIRFIIDALNVDPESVAYCAFTGKASQVLANKGNPNAMTLHKLLYTAIPTPEGNYIFSKNEHIEYSIVVCDECSMAPIDIVEDLLSHEAFVIFCGDPGQLPPIRSTDDNHLLDSPDIFLDEVMRQAADSGIIQLSMKIRNGESIVGFNAPDVKVLPRSQFVDGMINWADITLCATNATRKSLNEQARQLLGYTEPLVNGEKIICNHNYWNKVSSGHNGLTNGCIGYLNDFEYGYRYVPKFFKVPNNRIPIIKGNFITELDDNFGTVNIDKTYFMTEEKYLTSQQEYAMKKNIKFSSLIPFEFTYAYAITTHRAQGSEWNKVLVVEEGFPFKAEEHKKWLYTAVTRASEKLVLITKE